MKKFFFSFLGACYVALAVIAAFPTVQSDNATSPEYGIYHETDRLVSQSPGPGWSASDFTITIWGTPTCYYCTLLKKEIPTLKGYGYTVVYREDTSPRRFARHPTSVITYEVKGKTVKLMDIVGYVPAPHFHARIMEKTLKIDPC
jgi:thioredoxin-related protein